MKNILKITFILLFTLTVFGQKTKTSEPKFDAADFNKKFETAKWLVEYDEVAWKTSDEVVKQSEEELKRLGAEWFCFQDSNGLWHAVYGKYEKGKFDLVLHFTMDKTSKITKSKETIENEFLASYAIALITAQNKMREKIPADSPAFNQYIKRNADKTFNVWLFPAFQRNGLAVYGGEFVYSIDAKGEKIISDESYYQGDFRGFPTGKPREIWLNYSELKKPTLGSIFFVWYYRDYFTKIFIENTESTSTLIRDKEKGAFWVHVEKDSK